MIICPGMLCCAQVYVISRSRSKEELAHKMGAKGVIPSGDEEEMKKFAGDHKTMLRSAAC
jgi:D-arabinose 1-dehydrogenase-like Zn-dependent alcohol dehydrogenase